MPRKQGRLFMSYPTGAGPTDLPDGDYPNTKSPYSFYRVVNGSASLVDCYDCAVDPDNCLDGKMTFDEGTRAQLWAFEADTSYLQT
ncbi:hypothetical protein AB0D54_28110 [Streptomyces xanthophaeus]|uniref:hypothetical protein n=1 Tax=Streptomyces xanthophaeus TaxID=67385 RepID=UPI0034496C4F